MLERAEAQEQERRHRSRSPICNTPHQRLHRPSGSYHSVAEGENAQSRSRWFTQRDAHQSGLNSFGEVPGNHFRHLNRDDFYPAGHSTRRDDHTEHGGVTGQRTGSTLGQYRPIKMDPFPKDVKPSDKLFQWRNWLHSLKLALERGGVTGQRRKAVELSLSVGAEVNSIILTRNLLPDADEVEEGFKFFDFLVEGITSVFSRLTDASTSAREFRALKQRSDETVPEFALRTEKIAQKIGLTNGTLLTSAFIDGLKDRTVKEWASSFKWTMETTMDVATRRENEPETKFPWEGSSTAPIAVAAVERPAVVKEATHKQTEQSEQREKREHRDHYNYARQSGRDMKGSRFPKQQRERRCDKCGRTSHEDRPCPALNKQCYACKEMGHLERMCRSRRVRRVEFPKHQSEVSDNVFY